MVTPSCCQEKGQVFHRYTKQMQRLQSLDEKIDTPVRQFFHIERIIWRSYYSIVSMYDSFGAVHYAALSTTYFAAVEYSVVRTSMISCFSKTRMENVNPCDDQC